jgi:hypothetical protein
MRLPPFSHAQNGPGTFPYVGFDVRLQQAFSIETRLLLKCNELAFTRGKPQVSASDRGLI